MSYDDYLTPSDFKALRAVPKDSRAETLAHAATYVHDEGMTEALLGLLEDPEFQAIFLAQARDIIEGPYLDKSYRVTPDFREYIENAAIDYFKEI